MNIAPISAQMRQGLASSIFPGAALLIAYQHEIVFHEAFGHSMIRPKQKRLDLHTFFDLASLTKPLVTATAIALLLQQKLVHLHDPLVKFLPEFSGGEKEQVTLFHLLNHCSGLPAWQPYYQKIINRDKKEPGFLGSMAAKKVVFQMTHTEDLIAQPGKTSTYSDIGFILLGEVVEKVCEMTLGTYFSRHIASPLKTSECFFPGTDQTSPKSTPSFAATEDSAWRKGVILGTVHDDNAYVMGGIAGHAGLFATAFGVYQLVQAWLDSIKGWGFLSPDIAECFITRQKSPQNPVGASWALGWDTPSLGASKISSSGHYFSPASFGHLGFTGTSIWVDQAHELVVIFLSNRVHPKRENAVIRSFRPKLHDVIVETLIHG